jgi:hypothetical protein
MPRERSGGGVAASAPAAPADPPRLRPWAAGLAVFVVAMPLLLLFYSRHPLLYDTDSAYHLAVARDNAEQGLLPAGPALRMSALTVQGFADVSLGFHLLVAPFAGGSDALAGGRVALALLDGLLLATLAALGCRAVGWWGLLVPLWTCAGSLEVAWRLVRLRPELLSLILLLLALAAAGARRYRLLGALAAVYTLSYVPWHAFLGLFGLLFVFRGWARRRWDWPLLLYPTLGVLAGLVLHPARPANLVIWKILAFDFFALKGGLDVGSENRPDVPEVIVLANLGFWLVAATVWLARSPLPREREPGNRVPGDDRALAADTADAFGIATVCFGGLYALMSRYALYAYPFAALWLLYGLRARGETVGARVRLPFRGSVPTSVALTLAALLAVPGTAQELARFARRTDPGPRGERLADYRAFGRALPPGARVAAPWSDAATYLLWAPQGRYLNALDPVHMAVARPRAYAAQRSLFAGEEPDVPLVAVTVLDSDHLAWSLPAGNARLLARMAADPRAVPLHAGFQALFALRPAPPGTFWVDWRAAPGDEPPAAPALAGAPPYPRLENAAGRAIEGFVDAGRVADRRCVAFGRPLPAGADAAIWELAPAGPTRVWLDGEPLLALGGSPGAVLGEGTRLRLPASRPGAMLTVHTCPGPNGRTGFYWLRRG